MSVKTIYNRFRRRWWVPLFLMANFLSSFGLSAVRALEQQVLYRPYAVLDGGIPTSAGLPYQDLQLKTRDNLSLHAWWIPAAQTQSVTTPWTILYCHGNGGNISHRLDRAALYHRLGYNVLLFDYRGYGGNAGTPSEAGTYLDALAAWDYLTKTQGINSQRIVLYGESLGCAIALETAVTQKVGALILESPFTSTIAMAKRLFPQLPTDSMIQNRYDNLAKITRLYTPLLILHSRTDHTVPFDMGHTLYQAAPDPKTFVTLKGSHVFGYQESGQIYPNALQTFLNNIQPS